MFWQEYKSLTMKPECPAEVWVHLACSLFFLGLYKEAEEAASKGMHFNRVDHLNVNQIHNAHTSKISYADNSGCH